MPGLLTEMKGPCRLVGYEPGDEIRDPASKKNDFFITPWHQNPYIYFSKMMIIIKINNNDDDNDPL